MIARQTRILAALATGAMLGAMLVPSFGTSVRTIIGTGIGTGIGTNVGDMGLERVLAQGGGEEHVITIAARDTTGMAAFDVTLLYDPETVTFVEIRPGDFLPEGSEMLGPADGGDGSVSFGAFSPGGATVDGSGTLAEAVFSVSGDLAPDLRMDRDHSGLYGLDGAPLGPPAALSISGASAEAIYLPFAALRH